MEVFLSKRKMYIFLFILLLTERIVSRRVFLAKIYDVILSKSSIR